MEEIVKKILNENGIESFEELVKRYEKMVYGIAYRFLNNKQDAEDITQEVFLIVYRKIRNLRKSNSLTNWIYTISLNLTRHYMKKNSRENNLYQVFKDRLTLENKQTDYENLKEKIKISLGKLSPQQRDAIELKYFKGLKIKEISKIMNCKEGTVKVHLFRGIKALKEVLKNEKM
ncbi:MAG: RNA polymerase sigma factor [Candidatus Ratteibacteria bacterium]